MILFAVHPGPGVPAPELARLYELHPSEWVLWDDHRPSTYAGRRWEDYLHLYPSASGDYGRPVPA